MIFFHFVDTEIIELGNTDKKLPKNKLKTRISDDLRMLLALTSPDEVVVISPTFLFESTLCEEVLRQNPELGERCFVKLLMKEHSLDDVLLKKQNNYLKAQNIEKYKDAYYSDRLKKIRNLPFVSMNKAISVGTESLCIFQKLFLRNVEKGIISHQKYDEILKYLNETAEDSFLWELAYEKMANAMHLTEREIQQLGIRELMSASYLIAYKKAGVDLARDPLISPYIIGEHYRYDLDVIEKLFTMMDIKNNLCAMQCKTFCDLKLKPEFIRLMKKVRELLFRSEKYLDVFNMLEQEKVAETLKSIIIRSKLQMDTIKGEKQERQNIDVLIMVATHEEETAILKNIKWELTRTLVGNVDYFETVVKGVSFALARGPEKGQTEAAIMAQKLISELHPQVVTMAGFCAGKSGKVSLGDIVVAEKIYDGDMGKKVSESEIRPEISCCVPDPDWILFLQRQNNDWIYDLKMQSPKDFDLQCNELLFHLLKENTTEYEEVYDMHKYPDWKVVLEKLLNDNYVLLNGSSIELTNEGRSYIQTWNIKNPDWMISSKKPSVHFGCMGTCANVQEWKGVFNELGKRDRKTIALDMEAHAIGKIAKDNHIEFLVVKGVGDFADTDKEFANRFIEYACYVSCEYLLRLFTNDEFERFWRKKH